MPTIMLERREKLQAGNQIGSAKASFSGGRIPSEIQAKPLSLCTEVWLT